MMAAGKPRRGWIGRLVAVVLLAAGVATAIVIHERNTRFPSTDDAGLEAEVVHIAAAVGGRIVALEAEENGRVTRGQLLFRLDPEPYALAVAQAVADLDVARAALDARRRSLITERATAAIAADQLNRAEANHDLATRTVDRLRPLAERNFVPQQQFDQALTAQRDAATSLSQARLQRDATAASIGTLDAAEAAVRAREAALAIAERALRQTEVRAPHDGRVAGLSVLSGEFVAPAQSLFTLIVTENWYVSANMREGELPHIAVGDCVTAYSMLDRRQPLLGRVEGIGWGIMADDRINLPRTLPRIERSMNWVHVAARFPVRIRLEDPPEALMRAGASAVVQFRHGPRCH